MQQSQADLEGVHQCGRHTPFLTSRRPDPSARVFANCHSSRLVDWAGFNVSINTV